MSVSTSNHELSGAFSRSIHAGAGLLCVLMVNSVAVTVVGCGPSLDLPPELIGTWTHYEEFTQQEHRYEFAQDGTFTWATRDSGDYVVLSSGTFSTSNEVLVLEGVIHDSNPQQRFHTEQTYYANDSYLIPVAMFPEGEHIGLVGTWTGWVHSTIREGDEEVSAPEFSLTLEIFPDGTALSTSTDGDDTHTFTGSYTETSPGFSYEFSGEASDILRTHFQFSIVDERVLGMWLYEHPNQ